LAKKIGVPFRYSYLGRGPELAKLVRLTEELGLTSHVSFIDSLRGEAYADELKSGHIFLQPSLRESAGLTLIEAMAAGCVPVVANCGGPWDIASTAGVHAIPVSSVNEMAKVIAERLTELWNLPLSWSSQSESSARAICEKYSSEHYGTEINSCYRIAVTRGSD
jgi:glycosyltransferase involved in cell wall biosynthesis